jgi:hypothetical protein
MRMKAVGPRVLDPLTAVLQYLFAPPMLVAALAVGVGAHVWLYASRGLAGAIVDALYTPGFLVVLLGLILASGVAHEFGHAAGLRYGGGRARRMGFGFYLAFPAFFTDVTDSYRLGRWARVRTGLGGVYFHFLFATALVGAALVFDAEFLLLAVLLINVEIVRQFIPFVRLDGYWVLADLTGVPDFLSQAGPFVRSLLPAGRVRGTRLPKLKRWVKAAFLGYLVLTIPVLLAMLYLALRYLPTLATILWDAVATQVELFMYSWSLGDSLGIATAVAEFLVLVLPVFGLVYLLYLLSLKPIHAILTQTRPAVRLAGVTALTAFLALLGYWWAPQLPVAESATPAGVEEFDVADRSHTRQPVTYEQTPPVGGRHAPVWQNCGYYSRPVREENAVHSLEHGAVWITYRPQLSPNDVAALRRLANSEDYVLVSPYPDLQAPIVATAWGRQLHARSPRDARLERFVRAFTRGSQAPESGGPCTGGRGTPG